MSTWEPAPVTCELVEVKEAPAEVGLIGCCILGGTDTFLEVANVITPDAFSREVYRNAFELMAQMVRESVAIDTAAVMIEWRKKFDNPCPPSVWLSPDYTPSAANWTYFREDVLEAYGRRKIIETASSTLNAANEGFYNANELKAMLESVELGIEVGAFVTGQEPLAEAYRASVREQIKKGGQLAGLSTGFGCVDAATDGLVPGTMSVLAARPSEGKTALGLSFIYAMCFELQIPCLFISVEMPQSSILNRLASMATRIPARKIRKGEFNKDEKHKMRWFLDRLKQTPFYFAEAPGATVDEIERLIRIAVKKNKVVAVFVDYLQIIRYAGKLSRRHEQVQDNSQRLSALAKKLGPHICALAQVNRKSAEENRQPKVNEISDTDQIEKDAEIVLLLHRPKDDRGFRGREAILGLGKVREGETGAVKLEFDGPHVQFIEPETKIKQEDVPAQPELAGVCAR